MKIAIQKNGKLSDSSLKYLRMRAFGSFPEGEGLCKQDIDTQNQLYLLRDDDISRMTELGIIDMGIVGLDRVVETGTQYLIKEKLGFGFCTLVIAVPNASKVVSVRDLQGLTIATSYPTIARQFCNKADLDCSIIPVAGSVEVMPQLGLCEVILDITQTGQTLKQNSLRTLFPVLRSEAVLLVKQRNVYENREPLSIAPIPVC